MKGVNFLVEIKSISLPSQENEKITINQDLCISCGICVEVCPFGLPSKTESGKYQITNPEKCIECSACKKNCPTFAIRMTEQKGCGCLWDARARAKNPDDTCCC
ncbi:MAG: 4Fe-4S dicluster domain-containing protein [Candidatus Lokiarchaeota archaeon]|nr:4Fe-4S dicluster domain-containing protein [Candidatus Lokiarchaeota archaeon]MBD3201054.1 4Fe-4S dicluster domain-containing protein [Candidatus Lokiarchaeota archaeon]